MHKKKTAQRVCGLEEVIIPSGHRDSGRYKGVGGEVGIITYRSYIARA